MKKFMIIVDATCDISEDMQKEFGIEAVPGFIHLPDNTDIPQFLSWKDNDREEFYNKLKKNPNAYATAPANPEMFAEAFKKYARLGYDMLVLTMSSAMSGTYEFALKGREQALQELADSIAQYGLIQPITARRLDSGYYQIIAGERRWRAARLAGMGTIVGIKPIGEFDYNGMTTVIGKAKGAKKAYAVLLEYIKATIEELQEQMIFIAQTNRLAQAEKYKQLIEETIRPKGVRIIDVFPASGINVGPGLMAAYYTGKPISKDLKEEKELMNRLLNAE